VSGPLYACVDEYRAVLDFIHANEEVQATGVLPAELEALLEQAEGDLKTKAERVALVIRAELVEADAVAAEAERLANRAASHKRTAPTLKAYLHRELQRANLPRVDGLLASVRIQANSAPSIRLENPSLIPERFRCVTVEFDGKAALEYARAAKLIPTPEQGAVTFEGVVIERGTHLRVS
jgi:hypothetical protein